MTKTVSIHTRIMKIQTSPILRNIAVSTAPTFVVLLIATKIVDTAMINTRPKIDTFPIFRATTTKTSIFQAINARAPSLNYVF